MRDKPWFAVVYMFIVTGVFSSLVIGFSRYTQDKVDRNEQLQLEKAVLKVLPIDLPEDAGNDQLHQLYLDKVEHSPERHGGAYVVKDDDTVQAYAVPIAGQGFWAPIKGFLGVADDKQTVIGIAFYEQNETPGLGAEITQPAFTSQFQRDQNRVLGQDAKPFGIVRSGQELKNNQVYAVTGATQTSVRLEKIINDSVAQWREKIEE